MFSMDGLTKLGVPGSTLDSKIRALGIRKERFKG
jgi:hypothetical protein